MAVVYLARQLDLDRDVAVKEVPALELADPAVRRRFVREARLAGALSHPNIVTVYEYFETEHTLYIAMEYVERGALRPFVGRLTLAQIFGVLEGVLAGLTEAEAHDIVHRDIKPENLMVTIDGRIKIADFGIAKAIRDAATADFLTRTGVAVGTPVYMAPEQAMAQPLGPWTDLYATGVLAYELLSGRPPFGRSDEPLAVLLRHINEPAPPLRSIDPAIDARLTRWVERMMRKLPEDRPAGATAAADELEEVALDLLGPRWRRRARLVADVGAEAPANAWTAACFDTSRAPPYHPHAPTPSTAQAHRSAAPTQARPGTTMPPPAPSGAVQDHARTAARARRRRALASLAAVAMATGAGIVLAPTDDRTDAAAEPRSSASNGRLALSFPATWRPSASSTDIPGLGFAVPIALEPRSAAGTARLIAGHLDGRGLSLLPPAARRRLQEEPPRDDRVRIGSAVGYRYRDLRLKGQPGWVTLYVTPTTEGVATVACLSVRQDARFASECERVVSTMRLIAGRALPLGPDPVYAELIDREIRRLNRAKQHGQRELARTRSAGRQLDATRELTGAHERARKAFAAGPVPPAATDAHEAILRALARSGSAYAALGDAVEQGSRTRVRTETQDARRADALLRNAILDLRALGYRVVG